MKWITPLWRDPIGWSEKIAKTKLRVFLGMLTHIAFVGWGLFRIQKSNSITESALIIIFIGVMFPCIYLYALHRLLRIIQKNEKDNAQNP